MYSGGGEDHLCKVKSMLFVCACARVPVVCGLPSVFVLSSAVFVCVSFLN